MKNVNIVSLTPPVLGVRGAVSARQGGTMAASSARRGRGRRSAWTGAPRGAGSARTWKAVKRGSNFSFFHYFCA